MVIKKLMSLSIISSFTLGPCLSQEIKLSAENQDNSENQEIEYYAEDYLDLDDLATVFGESKDLEDFEEKLNDPEREISNLDLNKDGEVDYLKVLEKSEGDKKTVYIQAAVDEETFKNVALIKIDKDDKNNVSMEVVGDRELYGPDYVVIPAYRVVPPVVSWFWGPSYRVWVSPYRYGYHPAYFRTRAVVRPARRVTRTKARRTTRTVIIRN